MRVNPKSSKASSTTNSFAEQKDGYALMF